MSNWQTCLILFPVKGDKDEALTPEQREAFIKELVFENPPLSNFLCLRSDHLQTLNKGDWAKKTCLTADLVIAYVLDGYDETEILLRTRYDRNKPSILVAPLGYSGYFDKEPTLEVNYTKRDPDDPQRALKAKRSIERGVDALHQGRAQDCNVLWIKRQEPRRRNFVDHRIT